MANIFEKFFKKRKSILVNTELTVTLVEGNQLVFHDATREMYDFTTDRNNSDQNVVDYYYKVLQHQNELAEAARKLDTSKNTIHQVIEVKEKQKVDSNLKLEEVKQEIALVKEVEAKFPLLIGTGDFVEENGSMYLKAGTKVIPLSIPNTLLKRFVALAEKIEKNDDEALDEYMALKNFWMWLSLNPKATNREKLYDFITRNGLKINKHGLFFAYRMILSTNTDQSAMNKELVTAISDAYFRIKKAKKGPASFSLVKDSADNYGYRHINKEMGDVTVIGNVAALYAGLSESHEQMFTDNYTRTFDIRIGREVSQDASECDFNSDVTYSRGLHNGSVNYGLYNGFGDTPILTIINPMNVCAVPGQDVLRSTAYLPVSIITERSAKDVLASGSTLTIGEEYYTESVQQLKELIKNYTPQELVKHNFMSDISADAIKAIANSVENIPEILAKRVING